MKKILEIVPSNDQARKTIRRLEPLSAEKTRKDEGGNGWLVFLYFSLVFLIFIKKIAG